jgi:hypothetical protein
MIPTMLLLAATLLVVPSLLRSRSVKLWAVLGGFVVVFTIAIILGDYLTIRPLLRDIPRTSYATEIARIVRAR